MANKKEETYELMQRDNSQNDIFDLDKEEKEEDGKNVHNLQESFDKKEQSYKVEEQSYKIEEQS